MSAILDALDYLGSAVDKPGRAVRGVLSGNLNEGLAALPFSDTLGLTDPTQAVSGSQLLRQAGLSTGDSLADSALGFGAELALDPTTYLGGAIGRIGGKALGRGMEAAARMRGPGYATTADDLLKMVSEGGGRPPVSQWIADYANPKAFAEVPPGSRFIGAGREAAAFGTPAGDVVRLSMTAPEGRRPVADSVLQATRSVQNPGAGYQWSAERLPMADSVGDLSYWLKGSGQPGLTRMGAMKKAAADEGLRFHDVHAGNLGIVDGAPKIIDPGAVFATPGFTGSFQQVDQAGRPSLLMRALLDAMGGQPAMQRALDVGLAAPGYERSLGRTGMVAGGLGLGSMN